MTPCTDSRPELNLQMRSFPHHFIVVCCSAIVLSMMSAFSIQPENASSVLPLPTIPAPDPASLIEGKVVRILDADTVLIRIQGTTKRYQLIGVDAPQYDPADRTPQHFAIESKRFIEQLLLFESVYIQFDPVSDRDPAKRLSVYIFRAPEMTLVNLELVRQGYAKHDPRFGSLYLDSFEYYHNFAKQLSRGIWDPNAPSHELEPYPVESNPTQETQPTPSTTSTPTPIVTPLSTPTTDSSQTVYITKSGKSYHKEGCRYLSESSSSTTRDKVKSTHKPCKVCKPNG